MKYGVSLSESKRLRIQLKQESDSYLESLAARTVNYSIKRICQDILRERKHEDK